MAHSDDLVAEAATLADLADVAPSRDVRCRRRRAEYCAPGCQLPAPNQRVSHRIGVSSSEKADIAFLVALSELARRLTPDEAEI